MATALSYVISYFFIAIIWVNHHHLLRFAREATSLSKGLSTKGKADLRNVESALLQRFVPDRRNALNPLCKCPHPTLHGARENFAVITMADHEGGLSKLDTFSSEEEEHLLGTLFSRQAPPDFRCHSL